MNNSRQSLINELLKYSDISNKNDVFELYKLYSASEITEYGQIINSTNDFFECLKAHPNYSRFGYFKSAVDSAMNVVMPMVNSLSYNSFEKRFAEMVLEISPTKPENAHILDVGPNKLPISSLALATEAKKVSAMDKEFIFAIESLKSMNVNAMEIYFDENTNVDEYDFVVGKCPCSAIGHIVAQCLKANKPYFLELCNCAVPNRKSWIRDEQGNEVYTWKNVLPEIDPNVKFYEDYAFNIDASPKQVKKVIDSINGSILESPRFKVKSGKIYISNAVITKADIIKQNPSSENSDEKPWEFDWE